MAGKKKIVEKEQDCCCTDESHKYHGHHGHHGASGAVYGFGFIGAEIYFIQHADTFWMGALGILKALVWPALLVYKILEFLK